MRDVLLAALVTELTAAEAANDPSRCLRPEVADTAARLAGITTADDLEATYGIGWFHWYRSLAWFQKLPEHGDEMIADADAAVRALLPCFLAGAETLPAPLLPFLAFRASTVAMVRLGEAVATSDPAPIDAAVALWRTIVRCTPDDDPNRPARLTNLGLALRHRYQRSGAPGDLDDSIDFGRAALRAASPDHPERDAYRSNLVGSLRLRFEHSWVAADLDEATEQARRLVREAAPDDPERPVHQATLAGVLRVRFGWAGELGDLDEAVELGRSAVREVAADHPRRDVCLGNLSAALQTRFDRSGAMADLDETITVTRQAVWVTPAGHAELGLHLSMLCIALRMRYERTGAHPDLDEAVERGRDAVRATPAGNPNRAMYLSNLGLAQWRRSEGSRAVGDVDAAVASFRAATDSYPAGDPGRAIPLTALSVTLLGRYRLTGAAADLDDAVDSGREATCAAPSDDPRRALYLGNLAIALAERFGLSESAADLNEVVRNGTTAVRITAASPTDRIRAAFWATRALTRTDVVKAADMLESAVRLLPETAPRRIDRADQQHALGGYDGLACDAAALALAAATGDAATRALRLLELGRGVLLGQALDTRGDVSDLRARHPALADRFVALRDRLDRPTAVGDPLPSAGWPEYRPTGTDRPRLASAFEELVAEIRAQDGFRTFLRPPEPDQLIAHARDGPVVLVNASAYRCDALLVRPSGITTVPLPGILDSEVDQFAAFRQALDTVRDPDVGFARRRGAQSALGQVLEWLWDAVAEPVLDALGYRHPPSRGGEWPRLWWVPTGLLGLLPLHAAGYHRHGDGRTVLDRVVSSYTPTVRALGYARERAGQPAGEPAGRRAVVVAMPVTPGFSRLHHVADEARLVHTRLPGSTLLADLGNGSAPTTASVLAGLDGSAIAHFACHGVTHPTDPSQSRLLLHDHQSAPLTVASLASTRLDGARLAYLSACHTAAGSEPTLVDEAIHLATAFQLAGYPSVVGTLWEIDDALAVRVADAFYTGLRAEDGTVDAGRASYALHHAVRSVRDELPRTPSLWAGYLHAGA